MNTSDNKPDLSPKGSSINLQIGGYARTRRGHVKKIASSFKVGDNEVFVDQSGFQYRSDGRESYDRNLESVDDLVAVCDEDGNDLSVKLALEVGKTYINGLNEVITITGISEDVVKYRFLSDNGVYSIGGERRTIKENASLNLVREIFIDPDAPNHLDYTIALRFESFARHLMGRGLVTFNLSEDEKKQHQYDQHVMFIHTNAELTDEAVLAQVEEDCRELARLLNKFRIDKTYVTQQVIACDITKRQ